MKFEIKKTTGLLALLVPLLVFCGVLSHGWTYWDDNLTIFQNPRLSPPSWDGVCWYWQHAEADIYIPLTYTAWAALAALEPNPAAFHLASLVVHIGCAWLVYTLLRLLLQQRWPSAAGAILFAIHPVQVEVVAWASGFKDLLATFFSLLALWQYLLFVSGDRPAFSALRFHRRSLHMALSIVALALGLLAKPSAIVVPILACILDIFAIGRPWKRAVFSSAILGAVCIPFILITALVQTAMATPPVPLWQRPLIATDALAFYLYKLVLPVNLSPDYGRRPAVIFAHYYAWWTWLIPAGIGTLIGLYKMGKPWLIAGAFVFVAALLPVLGFVRFTFEYYSTVADHYLDLAMLGPALALGGFLAQRQRRAVYWICAAWLSTLAIVAVIQCRYWQDELTLWDHACAVAPDSFAAPNALGQALLRRDPANLDRAAELFRQAIARNPDFFGGRLALSRVLMAQGDREGGYQQLLLLFAAQDKTGHPLTQEMIEQRSSAAHYFQDTGRPEIARRLFNQVGGAR